MYSPHKHSYLQSRTQDINPRIINRTVQLARQNPPLDGFDLEPPFLRLSSEQPGIPCKNVDVTRRPVAFGRWALPKLRRELHHEKTEVVLQAVTSISDIVHDPERGYEAITLRIPDRMADLLSHEEPEIRERTLMALTTMAGLGDGKEAIVKNELSLTNIAKLVEDFLPTIRMKAAVLLEMLARSWIACDYLVEHGFLSLLLDNVIKETDEITALHLETLRLMMYGEGKDKVLELGGFDIFVYLMELGQPILTHKAAYCLMMLCSTYAGKEVAYDEKILTRLNVLLHNDDRHIYTSAAAAIMFCTIKSSAKIRAREIPGLPERLIKLAHDSHYPPTQIYAIKALTNICEHPEIRKAVRENYLENLEDICVGDNEDLKRYKEILFKVVLWVPWSAT